MLNKTLFIARTRSSGGGDSLSINGCRERNKQLKYVSPNQHIDDNFESVPIASGAKFILRSFHSTYQCILSKVYMLLSKRASSGTGNSLLEINVIKQVSNLRKYKLADNCPVLAY